MCVRRTLELTLSLTSLMYQNEHCNCFEEITVIVRVTQCRKGATFYHDIKNESRRKLKNETFSSRSRLETTRDQEHPVIIVLEAMPRKQELTDSNALQAKTYILQRSSHCRRRINSRTILVDPSWLTVALVDNYGNPLGHCQPVWFDPEDFSPRR